MPNVPSPKAFPHFPSAPMTTPRGALAVMTTIFFMWGFLTCLNDILIPHLKAVFDMPGGKDREWDLVPLEYFINEYKVEVRECTFQDICEIDTFRELKAIDPTYDVKA